MSRNIIKNSYHAHPTRAQKSSQMWLTNNSNEENRCVCTNYHKKQSTKKNPLRQKGDIRAISRFVLIVTVQFNVPHCTAAVAQVQQPCKHSNCILSGNCDFKIRHSLIIRNHNQTIFKRLIYKGCETLTTDEWIYVLE